MNTLQDLGKVAYVSKGAYDSTIEYEINDVVTYKGSSYVSKENENKGNVPSKESTHWQLVAEKGEKGDTPVKGKDYYTSEEQKELTDMVSERIEGNLNEWTELVENALDEINGEVI